MPPQVFENKKRNHLYLDVLVSAYYSSCVLNRDFWSTQTNKKYISFVHCNSEFTPLDSAGSLSTTYQLPTLRGAKISHTKFTRFDFLRNMNMFIHMFINVSSC